MIFRFLILKLLVFFFVHFYKFKFKLNFIKRINLLAF